MEKKLSLKKLIYSSNIGIIVDDGKNAGSGHLVRTLNLADQLISKKNKIYFMTSHQRINFSKKNKINILINKYKKINFDYIKKIIIKNKIKILIVDSYKIKEDIQKKFKQLVKVLILFSDMVKSKNVADVLINNNFVNSKEIQIIKKRNLSSFYILGPRNILLNKSYLKYKKKILLRKKINKIFVFFGNSEPKKLTLNILKILIKFNKIKVVCIIGKYSKNKNIIKSFCIKQSIKYFINIKNTKMMKIMIGSDLAIGSAGVNLIERIFLGLPSIIISTANNQLSNAINFNKKKLVIYAGHFNGNYQNNTENILNKLIKNKKFYNYYSKKNFMFYKNNDFFKLKSSLTNIII